MRENREQYLQTITAKEDCLQFPATHSLTRIVLQTNKSGKVIFFFFKKKKRKKTCKVNHSVLYLFAQCN